MEKDSLSVAQPLEDLTFGQSVNFTEIYILIEIFFCIFDSNTVFKSALLFM